MNGPTVTVLLSRLTLLMVGAPGSMPGCGLLSALQVPFVSVCGSGGRLSNRPNQEGAEYEPYNRSN